MASQGYRLFFALPLPDPVRAEARRAAQDLRLSGFQGRYTAESSWHLTVLFAGEVAAGHVPDFMAAGAHASAVRAEELMTADLGAFPHRAAPRVVVLQIAGQMSWLHQTARVLQEELAVHLKRGRQPLTPHVTLLRVSRAGLWPDSRRNPVRFTPDRLILFRSHLAPTGPTYQALASWPLARAGV